MKYLIIPIILLFSCTFRNQIKELCPDHNTIRFLEDLPSISQDKVPFIRKIQPTIDCYFDNPNDYYIKSVSTDSFVRVTVCKISYLRIYDIYSKQKRCTYTFNIDDSERPIIFTFNKNGDFIKCLNNWKLDCKNYCDSLR